MLKAKTILKKCFNHWESTINGALNFNESKGRNLSFTFRRKKKMRKTVHFILSGNT